MNNNIDYLKLIESQIKRMADNSFKIKSWAITSIGGGLLFWFSNKQLPEIAILVMIITLLFWWMDAYYLRLEKCYRDLYKKVAEESNQVAIYSLDVNEYKTEINKIILFFFRLSLLIPYGTLLIFEIIVFYNKYIEFK